MSDGAGDVTKNPRTIILCFDGTASQYSNVNTNVVKFFSLLKKDVDLDQQLCYYQPGIGTWFNPGVVDPLFEWGAKLLDEAFAWYLDAHVLDGYRFLMQNYRVGDRICLFGFSRGSYTARALAGALYKVGLLQKDNEQQLPFAYKLYKRKDKAGIALAAGFKQTFCQNVKIDFVGVWDTVASVGVLMSRTLPFTSSNSAIKTFRHALSLDEHRAEYRPSLYHRPSPSAAGAVFDPEGASPIIGPDSSQSDQAKLVPSKSKGVKSWFRKPLELKLHEVEEESADDGNPTDVLEVWFAGCHSDVGGGAVPDTQVHDLANIPLRWMVREVMQAQCGVQFDEAALVRASIPRYNFLIQPTDPKDEQLALDAVDALEPIHDELKMNPLWWILEIVPTRYSWQDDKGVWHRQFRWNLGKGRKIPTAQPKFHATVKQRIADSNLKYKPKARWTAGSEVYVG